jgi:hypothetical protein
MIFFKGFKGICNSYIVSSLPNFQVGCWRWLTIKTLTTVILNNGSYDDDDDDEFLLFGTCYRFSKCCPKSTLGSHTHACLVGVNHCKSLPRIQGLGFLGLKM